MAWSDYNKERFYDEIKSAIESGADASQLIQELKNGCYIALDEIKKQFEYQFKTLLK